MPPHLRSIATLRCEIWNDQMYNSSFIWSRIITQQIILFTLSLICGFIHLF